MWNQYGAVQAAEGLHRRQDTRLLHPWPDWMLSYRALYIEHDTADRCIGRCSVLSRLNGLRSAISFFARLRT